MIKPFLEKKKEKVDFSEGNKLKAFILVSIFLSFFLINFISAVPPVQSTIVAPQGLEIEATNFEYMQQGVYHVFRFRVYNATNDIFLNDDAVNCSMGIIDDIGEYVFQQAIVTATGYVFMVNVSAGNFSKVGLYHQGINCITNDGTTAGGVKTLSFEVSRLGYIFDTSHVIGSSIYLILIIFLMFTFGIVGFHLFQNKYLWILGLFLVVLAAFLLVYSSWLGYEYYNYLTGLPASNMPEIIFYIFLFIIGSGLLASLVLLFIHWKEVFKYFKRELKKKESDEDLEDWDFDEWR